MGIYVGFTMHTLHLSLYAHVAVCVYVDLGV